MTGSPFRVSDNWLTNLPSHWRKVRLKLLTRQILSGGTPPKSDLSYWDGDIPWVSPKDMRCRYIDSTIDRITRIAVAESATQIVPVGTVLIVVRSGILKHSIPVAVARRPVAINQDIKALVCSEEIRPEYLAYFIDGFQKQLLPRWRKIGTTVESIEHDYMANEQIPVPTVPEQELIVRFLDDKLRRVDALIDALGGRLAAVSAARGTLLALSMEYRSSLITCAITGRVAVPSREVMAVAQ